MQRLARWLNQQQREPLPLLNAQFLYTHYNSFIAMAAVDVGFVFTVLLTIHDSASASSPVN